MKEEVWLLFIRTAIKPWPCAAYCAKCHVPLHDKCADPVHVREANGRSLLHKTSPSIAEILLGRVEPLVALSNVDFVAVQGG